MIWEVGGEIRRLPASIETPAAVWADCGQNGNSSLLN